MKMKLNGFLYNKVFFQGSDLLLQYLQVQAEGVMVGEPWTSTIYFKVLKMH